MPSLPIELVTKILEYADYKTVTACRRLCRRLKDIVDTTSSLRYIVELGANGMCDGPPDAVGPAERLRKLEGSRAAWKSRVWSQPVDFPYSKKAYPSPLALSGNLAVLNGPWNGHAGLFVRDEFLLLRFPSEARGIPEQLWYLNLDCERIDAIALDDSQDLLVFSCLSHIHVRTLSSGCVHPLSSTLGLIDFGTNSPEYETNYLCIQDDRLAFMASVPPRWHGDVLVWDWKTGKQVALIPCDYRFTMYSFLDRSSIMFPYHTSGQQQVLCLRVVTFESPNLTKETALRYYHFEFNVLGSLPQQTYFHNINTLPSNTTKSCIPGFFHSEPSSRLLALEVRPPITDFILEGDIPLHVLYIPHDVFLGYIMSHPPNTDTVVVPWEAWGLGNPHIITLPDLPDRFLGSKMVCGMHVMPEPPVIISKGDQKMLRIMDCHPRRVANTVMQDSHLRLGGAVHSHEGLGPSSTTEWQEVCIKKIPYVFKDIPLPDGLRWENIKCMLGEDVVAVFKYSLGTFGRRIEKVFYHPI